MLVSNDLLIDGTQLNGIYGFDILRNGGGEI